MRIMPLSGYPSGAFQIQRLVAYAAVLALAGAVVVGYFVVISL